MDFKDHEFLPMNFWDWLKSRLLYGILHASCEKKSQMRMHANKVNKTTLVTSKMRYIFSWIRRKATLMKIQIFQRTWISRIAGKSTVFEYGWFKKQALQSSSRVGIERILTYILYIYFFECILGSIHCPEHIQFARQPDSRQCVEHQLSRSFSQQLWCAVEQAERTSNRPCRFVCLLGKVVGAFLATCDVSLVYLDSFRWFKLWIL